VRRADQCRLDCQHFARGGDQRGRVVLHVLAHHLLRDVERECDQRFRNFVLRAIERGLEGFRQCGEARGFFARFGLPLGEALRVTLVVASLVAERLAGHVTGGDALSVRGIAQALQFGFEGTVVDHLLRRRRRHWVERGHLPALVG
jgi:hypothetical protein